jgi:hypothetical protein
MVFSENRIQINHASKSSLLQGNYLSAWGIVVGNQQQLTNKQRVV